MKCLVLAFLLSGSAVLAQPVDDLQRDDAIALSTAWRLQQANAPFCSRIGQSIGIGLEDTAEFPDPAQARAVYNLSGDIFIGAVAAASPGAKAGLAVNTTLAAIDDHRLAELPAPPKQDPFARQRLARDILDQALARNGAVDLTLANGQHMRISAVPVCRVAIAIDDAKSYASANRDEIRLGRRAFDVARGDPEIVAALIAHEMAHVVLDHQSALEASHSSLHVVRRTEREADRLSVWLLANAGYRPEAALRWQQTYVAHFNGFLTIDPTHGGWKSRAAVVAQEITALRSAPDTDWSRHFRREPD